MNPKGEIHLNLYKSNLRTQLHTVLQIYTIFITCLKTVYLKITKIREQEVSLILAL